MTRVLSIFALVLVTAFTLAGCGDDGDGGTPSTGLVPASGPTNMTDAEAGLVATHCGLSPHDLDERAAFESAMRNPRSASLLERMCPDTVEAMEDGR